MNDTDLTLDLVDGLSKATNVVGSDTSNAYAAVLGGIDAVLLGQLLHAGGVETSVGEHADLRGDVAPVLAAAKLLEVLFEESPHGDDAVGHLLDLTQPLLVEGGGVENLRGDAGTVNGRVGVQRADKDLDLRVDALLLLGRCADDGEGAYTLAVETLYTRNIVLAIRLR
jgi:hypothetical protein